MSPSIPESAKSAYFGLRKISTLQALFESWPILFQQNILPWPSGAWVRCLVMIMSPDSGLCWSQGTCHDQSSVQVTWSALTNQRAVCRSRNLSWPITSREIVCHNNHRRHWRQHIFSKKQYHMTFELIMDSKNIYKIKSQHHDDGWTSKVRPSTMKVCPRNV